ncbi:MAG: flagellar biosynthesis anti-sigma factor FlgM [Pyrinomonadaceae bacterium]
MVEAENTRGKKKMSTIILEGMSGAIAICGSESNCATPEKQPQIIDYGIIDEEKLNFFNRAETISRLVEKLEELTDIRHDRVAALREKIAAGEYKPEGYKIANAILKDER